MSISRKEGGRRGQGSRRAKSLNENIKLTIFFARKKLKEIITPETTHTA